MKNDNGKFMWIAAFTGIIFDALCIINYFISGKFFENVFLTAKGQSGGTSVQIYRYFIPTTMLVPTFVLCIVGLLVVLLILSYSHIDRRLMLHIKTIAVVKAIVLVAAGCYTGIYLVTPAIITQQGTNPLVVIQNFSVIFQPIIMVASYVAFAVVYMNFKQHKCITAQFGNVIEDINQASAQI